VGAFFGVAELRVSAIAKGAGDWRRACQKGAEFVHDGPTRFSAALGIVEGVEERWGDLAAFDGEVDEMVGTVEWEFEDILGRQGDGDGGLGHGSVL
jgi:hypothetical protein